MIRDQLATKFDIHDGNIYLYQAEGSAEISHNLEYVRRPSLEKLLPLMMQYNPMKGVQAQLALTF